MTDTTLVDPTNAGELAQKIVDLLNNENSGTRRRAIQAAMTLLGEAAPPDAALNDGGRQPIAKSEDVVDLGQFFNRGEKLKPSDNAQLCAAYHYSIYGPVAFTLDELRAIGANAGVVLPDRLDMTLSQATHGGKKLFQSAGRGAAKPTASAGVAFGEKWGVKPGRQVKSTD
jgi:hypothetical protein